MSRVTAPRPRDLLASGLPLSGDSRDTSRLKDVPAAEALRERIAAAAAEIAAAAGPVARPGRCQLEAAARRLLAEMLVAGGLPGLDDGRAGLGLLATTRWPPCPAIAGCCCCRSACAMPRPVRPPATPPGLHCRDCGGLRAGRPAAEAQRLGYRVLIAEGSPAVMQIILSGQVDAILGVACLDVLEKTFDKILLAGIPCMAVPLLGNGCRNTAADEDWVLRMIDTPHRPAPASRGPICT